MSSKEMEMPLSLMAVIFIYFLSGISSVLDLLVGNGLDVISIFMLPVALLLFLRKGIGVIGLQVFASVYAIIWLVSLILFAISDNSDAVLSVFGRSIEISPILFHFIFAAFCALQLFTAFLSGPSYMKVNAKA